MSIPGWGRRSEAPLCWVSERPPASVCKFFGFSSTHYTWQQYLPQVFCHIFTSPSSAHKQNMASKVTSRRHNVATTLHLNGCVTPHSIAYTATQVRWYQKYHSIIISNIFHSSSSSCWIAPRTGRPSMLASITQHSTTLSSISSKTQKVRLQREKNNKLLQWWNRYVWFYFYTEN